MDTDIILYSTVDNDIVRDLTSSLKQTINVASTNTLDNDFMLNLDIYDYSVSFIDSEDSLKESLPVIWLFIGRFGVDRTFIVRPSNLSDSLFDDIRSNQLTYDWPSDLLSSQLIEACCSTIKNKINENRSLEFNSNSFTNNTFDVATILDKQSEWTLFLEIENETMQLVELTASLRKGKSKDGRGKKFTSGFAYWGLGPTLAWSKAAHDPLYSTMYQGILRFPQTWKKLEKVIKEQGDFHYVSLGSGTGEKDRTIYSSLVSRNPNVRYFPVDLTKQMLNLAVNEVTNSQNVRKSKILPIKTNFAKENYQKSLRNILDDILDDKPILLSLLGNTIANFENHQKELKNIVQNILKKDDLFLLEIAYTKGLEDRQVKGMINEYDSTNSLKLFHTAALLQNTDLDIDYDSVDFLCEPIGGNNLELRIVYRNIHDKKTVNIQGGNDFLFEDNDTIRLYLTRKYTDRGIENLIGDLPLKLIDQNSSIDGPIFDYSSQFGLKTLLFKKD